MHPSGSDLRKGTGATAPLTVPVPGPGKRRIALRVAPEAERALRRGHPWVFDSAIRQQSHEGRPGDLAVVFDRKGRFLAVGLYDPLSAIRVRVLAHGEPTPIDRDWFRRRLASAAQLRAPLLEQPREAATTGYRVVHGENDGFPGLVIDRYEGTAVLKLYTSAWIPHLRDLLAALEQAGWVERAILRLGRAARRTPETLFGLSDGATLRGPALPGPVLFSENGLRFEADPVRGQKTGFFLDQRDNRARVEQLAGGRAVLNLFAYSGGFSIYAARGGARQVVSIDTSAPALEAAKRNWEHNQQVPGVAAACHEVVVEDAFEGLVRMAEEGRRFDMVVVDPPSFARRQEQAPQALAAYRRLTRLSLRVLRPGGVLVQASCSSQVGAQTFFAGVHASAGQAGHALQEIGLTGHPLDHPVTFPEGAYLKCIFAMVR